MLCALSPGVKYSPPGMCPEHCTRLLGVQCCGDMIRSRDVRLTRFRSTGLPCIRRDATTSVKCSTRGTTPRHEMGGTRPQCGTLGLGPQCFRDADY